MHLWHLSPLPGFGWVEGGPEDLEAKDQVQTGARGYRARTTGPQANQETKK